MATWRGARTCTGCGKPETINGYGPVKYIDIAPNLGYCTDCIIQTACRHCGQDIESLWPFRRGEWRDRGNNPTCPTPEGDAGQVHEPVSHHHREKP